MQQFIPKMYIKELINEEQHEEQQKWKETMLRIEEAGRRKPKIITKKKEKSTITHTKGSGEKVTQRKMTFLL